MRFIFLPNDAHPMVKDLATVKLSTKGGHGVIREILEDHFNINIYKLFMNEVTYGN